MLKLSTVSPSSCSPSSTSSSAPSTSTTSPPQVMRQLEGSRAASAMSSMAGSRSTTPLPHAPAPHPHLDHFDPHAEIRELHGKLEELRRLNYSLDVELQRERGERQELGTRWGQCKMAICFHFYLLNLIIYSNLFIFYCPLFRVMAPRARHASQVLPDSPSRVQVGIITPSAPNAVSSYFAAISSSILSRSLS